MWVLIGSVKLIELDFRTAACVQMYLVYISFINSIININSTSLKPFVHDTHTCPCGVVDFKMGTVLFNLADLSTLLAHYI